MWIIFRYLNRQILTSMLAVALVLLLVFMSGRFIKYLANAAAGEISGGVLFAIMGYRLPEFLELILPLSMFIGILLAYGRMYLESEMTVLFACGVSDRQLIALSMGSGLLITGIVAALSLYITPLGMQQVDRIFTEQSQMTEFEMLAPGRFQSIGGGERVTYTEAMSDNKRELYNVFLAEGGRHGDSVVLMMADKGTQIVDEDGERFLVLHNGSRFEGHPGGVSFDATTFDAYGMRIEVPGNGYERRSEEAIPTQALRRSDNPENRALFHWRVALPVLVPIVTLLAVRLSRVNPRQGRFFHLLPAILLYISYLALLIVGRDGIASGSMPDWLGLWWVHGIYLLLALVLYAYPSWQRRRRASLAVA